MRSEGEVRITDRHGASAWLPLRARRRGHAPPPLEQEDLARPLPPRVAQPHLVARQRPDPFLPGSARTRSLRHKIYAPHATEKCSRIVDAELQLDLNGILDQRAITDLKVPRAAVKLPKYFAKRERKSAGK